MVRGLLALTTQATAESIVAACDAWLLANVGSYEAVFSYSANGVFYQCRGYAEVLALRDRFAQIAATAQRGRRVYAEFVD